MDIFTLTLGGGTYRQGKVINGLTSKLWVERYRAPGEFKFTCKPTARIRQQLAIGTLVSHVDTYDVHIVESHEINEDKTNSDDIELVITGRSLDSFLEQRVATDDGQGFYGPTYDPEPTYTPLYDGTAWPYWVEAETPWGQCVKIIRSQIDAPYIDNRPSFAIPNVAVAHSIGVDDVTPADLADWTLEEDKEVPRGVLSTTVMDLMSEFNGGLKVERPRIIPGPPRVARTDIWWIVHRGENKRYDVQFTYDQGDLEKARYLWSNKSVKNAVYVASSHYGVFHDTVQPHTGLDRRVGILPASDLNANPLDDGWAAVATVAKLEAIMRRRAQRFLGRKKIPTEIMEATVSKSNNYKYRRDYNIGDVVRVVGNYDMVQDMRVTEFTEIEDDQEGEYGYPSLSKPNA